MCSKVITNVGIAEIGKVEIFAVGVITTSSYDNNLIYQINIKRVINSKSILESKRYSGHVCERICGAMFTFPEGDRETQFNAWFLEAGVLQ